MSRRIPTIALLVCALPLLTPGRAAAQYPVQQRLCDVAYQNCRTQILDLINAEPSSGSIDVAFWFMREPGRQSAARRRIADEMFYQPGTATTRALSACYDLLELARAEAAADDSLEAVV